MTHRFMPTGLPGADSSLHELHPVTCYLTTLDPDSALSASLVGHLSDEIRTVRFTREASPGVDSIWLCGCRAGCGARVADLRREHPEAMIVVTGRGANGAWRSEALEAGADRTADWPIAYPALERFLTQKSSSIAV